MPLGKDFARNLAHEDTEGCGFIEDFNFTTQSQYWRCEECGYRDEKKPMPSDRAKWFAKGKPHICPKCKSEAFQPYGW